MREFSRAENNLLRGALESFDIHQGSRQMMEGSNVQTTRVSRLDQLVGSMFDLTKDR